MELIKIKNLHKSFEQTKVLNGLSLIYESKRIYGMIGENGAGKTTFFKCILGLLSYNGTIIKEKNLKIGYLPSENFFYSLITGWEYLEFCIKASGNNINISKVEELNLCFQLPLHKYASEYSTGMKKKLAFMALLLQEIDVYILDEPFNGVDLKGCILLKRLIRELKNRNKTIIISSHQISALHEICDNIHYLNKGIITHEFTNESIAEIETIILTEENNLNFLKKSL